MLHRKSSFHGRDHQTTLAYARSALENIAALQQPADPPSFEVWYAYATGRSAALNQAINSIVGLCGTLTLADLSRVYSEFLSPAVNAQRIDMVGSQLANEVEQIITAINDALTSSTSYGKILADTDPDLAEATDRDALKAIVQNLTHRTKVAATENDRLLLRLAAIARIILSLQANLKAIHAESHTDPLTKLANREYFDEVLSAAVLDGRHATQNLSLLMCDVDHFKKFNDEFGYPLGDHVLRLLAATIRQSVREGDVAARFGGEEFAVVLPNVSLMQARTVAENIRATITERALIRRPTNERLGRITVSIGVVELRPHDTSESLLERADACLCRAKLGGRNRVAW